MSLLERMEKLRQTKEESSGVVSAPADIPRRTAETASEAALTSTPAPPPPLREVERPEPARPMSAVPPPGPPSAPASPTAGAAPDLAKILGLKHQLMDEILPRVPIDLVEQSNPTLLRSKVEDLLLETAEKAGLTLTRGERTALTEELINEVAGMGPLEPLLNDPTVSKITVNAPEEIYIERFGKLEPYAERGFRDDAHLMSLIQKVAAAVGGRIDPKVPLLDRKLPDGSRIRAKIPPIASSATITIDGMGGTNPFEELKREIAKQQEAQEQPYYALKERIQDRLIQELDIVGHGATDRERLRQQIQDMMNAAIAEENLVLSRAERSELAADLENEILGLGPLEPLLNDPEVSEIMVNGPRMIYVERAGKLTLSERKFRDDSHVMQVIEKIVAPLGRRIDEKSPMVDGRLADGSRVNAIIPPLALNGPTVTIRKFSKDPFTITDLVNFGTMTNEVAQFLRASVEARLNVIVSGGTGSGKTTLLNVLSSFIPSGERIVTIEDAAELQLRQDHVVRLESRPPNIEGQGRVTIRDLVVNALRMRPDRIVIGECRGGEALDMLQAMNTGHDGSLTTAHANNPREMLSRLETLVLMAGMELPLRAIREQIAAAVDLIVQIQRMRDGSRRVSVITEIVGMESEVITMQDLFVFEQEGIDDAGKIVGRLKPAGLRPKCYERLLDMGAKLPLNVFQRN